MYIQALLLTKAKKNYKNALGTFTYRDVPAHIYPNGIEIVSEKNYSYAIATAEKALCDKLYSLKTVKNKEEMFNLLFNDLRIDIVILKQLEFKVLYTLCDNYKSTNMKYLKKVLGDIN